MNATQRDASLDILRIVACMMVVMMHAPIPLTEGQTSPMLGAISYLMAPCNGLFFMASGALLFSRRLPLLSFMKKRLGRVALPVVIWSIVYIIVKDCISGGGILQQILWIPFCRTDACGYLWFMYALLGCYFLVPIVSPWLEKATRREVEAVTGLWLLAAILPMITVYLDIPRFDEHSAWYYFGGFFGYFVLGWYASRFPISRCRLIMAVVGGVGLMGLSFLQKGAGVDINCYLHPYVILFCFAIFVFVKKLFARYRPKSGLLSALSASTFGVYLIHSLILNHFLKRLELLNDLPVEVGILTRWALTLVIGFAVVLLLRKLPGHKYLIG